MGAKSIRLTSSIVFVSGSNLIFILHPTHTLSKAWVFQMDLLQDSPLTSLLVVLSRPLVGSSRKSMEESATNSIPILTLFR